MKVNMTMRALIRAITDDCDAYIGGDPQNEQEHDELIERAIAGEFPVTETVGAIAYTLRWLQDHQIMVFEPNPTSYEPPPEWREV